MSIELSDRTLAIWFVDISDAADWMAAIESLPTGGYKLTGRLRIVRDQRVFGSNDEKKWFGGFCPDLAIGIEGLRAMAQKLNTEGGKVWELLRGTATTKQFFDELRKLPFANTREGIRPEKLPNAPATPKDRDYYEDAAGRRYQWYADPGCWLDDSPDDA